MLCFGRIDSKLKPVAGEKFIHYFSKRKANSVRSKFNQEIIMRLTSRGLLAKAGEDSVAAAKENCSHAILDEVAAFIPQKLWKLSLVNDQMPNNFS